MLTPKQNLMETITWGNPEYVPCTFEAFAIMLPALTNERGLSLAVGDDRLPRIMDEWMKCCRY